MKLMKVWRRLKAFDSRIFLMGNGMDNCIPPKGIGIDNRIFHTESVRRVTAKNAAGLVLCLNSTVATGLIEIKPGLVFQ
jgi:hypothetical protein